MEAEFTSRRRNKLRIAVFGGAGFLGCHLVSQLVSVGHEVLVIDSLFAGRDEGDLPWSKQVPFVKADILDSEKFRSDLERFAPDVVYHLAAVHYIPYCNEHPIDTLRVNVEGTLSVLLHCAAIPSIKSLIFASSLAVYSASSDWHVETEAPAPIDIYGLSKSLGEQLVRHFCKTNGIASICARLTNLYGPMETNRHIIPEILGQIRGGARNVRLGRTDTYRDFMYVKDAAAVLIRLLDTCSGEQQQIVNLVSGKEHSIDEVLDLLIAEIGDCIEVIRDETRVRPNDRKHLRGDATKLIAMIGKIPETPISSGLAETVTWELRRAQAASA